MKQSSNVMGNNNGLVEGNKKDEISQPLRSNDNEQGHWNGTIDCGCAVSRVLLALELLQSLRQTAITVPAL